nr:unnamed protein product [Callosobruchus analis]
MCICSHLSRNELLETVFGIDFGAPSTTAQLVNYILQQIDLILTNLLEDICNLTSPVVALVDTFRRVVIENLITTLRFIAHMLTALPQYSVPVNILTQVLTATNITLASANNFVRSNVCGLTTSGITVGLLHTGNTSTLVNENHRAKQEVISTSAEQFDNHISAPLASGMLAILRTLCN